MENQLDKYISVTYKLLTVVDGKEELVEEATADRPFQFISGFGITLEDFEKGVSVLKEGDNFDLQIPCERAYGEYMDEHVLELDKEIFTINGHFDHDNIFQDAVVPLQNEEGRRFMGRVLEITDDKVKMDMNHPLAGKDLHFVGVVLEHRDATNEEIQMMVNQISGEGHGCGCGSGGCGCGDSCGCGSDDDGGCASDGGCGCGHGGGCGCGH